MPSDDGRLWKINDSEFSNAGKQCRIHNSLINNAESRHLYLATQNCYPREIKVPPLSYVEILNNSGNYC